MMGPTMALQSAVALEAMSRTDWLQPSEMSLLPRRRRHSVTRVVASKDSWI